MKEEFLSSNEWENGNVNGNGNVSVNGSGNGQWDLAQEVDSIYMELGEIAKSLDKIRQRLANITKAASGQEVTGKELSLPGASFPGPLFPGASLSGLSESQMDERIFHPSFDMRKLKQAISDLGILPSERNRWCVVFLVLRENSIIASNASEQEFYPLGQGCVWCGFWRFPSLPEWGEGAAHLGVDRGSGGFQVYFACQPAEKLG